MLFANHNRHGRYGRHPFGTPSICKQPRRKLPQQKERRNTSLVMHCAHDTSNIAQPAFHFLTFRTRRKGILIIYISRVYPNTRHSVVCGCKTPQSRGHQRLCPAGRHKDCLVAGADRTPTSSSNNDSQTVIGVDIHYDPVLSTIHIRTRARGLRVVFDAVSDPS